MAKAIATQEAVFAVADAIVREGGEPKVILVQARVGGGSYTTTRRLLDEWRDQRASQPVIEVDMPSEIADKAGESLRLIWQSAVAIAQRNAQAVVDQAGVEVAAMREQLDEALEVVQRLEHLEVELRATAEAERQRAHDFELQVASLSVEAKRVREVESELDALRKEYAQSADVRSTLAELRAQVGELLSARPKPGSPTRK